MMKTFFATSLYLLITSLTYVNGFNSINTIQNSKFPDTCLTVLEPFSIGQPLTLSVVFTTFDFFQLFVNIDLGRHAKAPQQNGVLPQINLDKSHSVML